MRGAWDSQNKRDIVIPTKKKHFSQTKKSHAPGWRKYKAQKCHWMEQCCLLDKKRLEEKGFTNQKKEQKWEKSGKNENKSS